ncbi:hypothetical protein RRG08_047624 [Elysia crispata]|uniref:Uncharacterized protein n=1 Tax=Elysia crispata TaxID=231223 RepID=A0AAE1BFI1_9GAST|nr:hypothetical protein RRG08_047624 [Elysia crispata]
MCERRNGVMGDVGGHGAVPIPCREQDVLHCSPLAVPSIDVIVPTPIRESPGVFLTGQLILATHWFPTRSGRAVLLKIEPNCFFTWFKIISPGCIKAGCERDFDLRPVILMVLLTYLASTGVELMSDVWVHQTEFNSHSLFVLKKFEL